MALHFISITSLLRAVQERLYFLRFEDLITQPVACMSHIYAWLELAPHEINTQQLSKSIPESDSHYHMKYPHSQASEIKPPQRHEIPPRIQAQIESAYGWFYQSYYPKS